METLSNIYYNYMSEVEMKIASLLTDKFIIEGHSDGIFVEYNSADDYRQKLHNDLIKYKNEILTGIKDLIKQVPLLIDHKFSIQISRGEIENIDAEATIISIYNERKSNISSERHEEAIPSSACWISNTHNYNIIRSFNFSKQHCETVANFISAVVIPILTVSLFQRERNPKKRKEILSYSLHYIYD